MPPALFFLLRIVLAMQTFFWFHIKFKVVFFQFCEENQWQLDRDSIESINYFGHSDNLHDIASSYPQAWGVFPLFVSSLISLSSVLSFSLRGPSHPL